MSGTERDAATRGRELGHSRGREGARGRARQNGPEEPEHPVIEGAEPGVPQREGLVYGVGALRGAARGDRILWALHRAALSNGIVPLVPSPAVAEGFRSEARGDRLEWLLSGSEVEDLGPDRARRVGELAARASTTDLVAAAVAEVAARRNCAVVATRQNALRTATGLLGHELVLYGV